jgi:hypothetical protein
MFNIRVVSIAWISFLLFIGSGVSALTYTPTPSTTITPSPTLTPTRANAASSGPLLIDDNLPDLAIADVRLVSDMRYASWCAMTDYRYLIVEITGHYPGRATFFMLKVNDVEILVRDYFQQGQSRWYWFSEATIGEVGQIEVIVDSQNDVTEMDEGNNQVTVRDLQASVEAVPRCPATATPTTTYTPGPSPTITPGPSPTPTPT